MRLAHLLLLVSLLSPAACRADADKPVSPAKVATTPSAATPSAAPAPAAASEPQQPSARVLVETPAGTAAFRVEIADDDPERARGLMMRDQMDDDAGMLFVFPRMHVQSFWMKNTHLPLDMLFIDDKGVIVGIVENAEPMTTTSRTVGKPSQYVLELNAGTCRQRGVAAGQVVRFEGVPGHPVHAGGGQ